MPWKSDKQRRWGHTAKGIKALGGKAAVAEWDRATKFKKKPKIVVNNKMKAYGQTDVKTGVVEINKKKHKGDKKQLADTIKHELYHVKHPKATEKQTYKNTGKLENMSQAEQTKLIAKLRMKKINYKGGAMKRKLKLKGDLKPGDMISKMNGQAKPFNIKNINKLLSKTRVSIMGLV